MMSLNEFAKAESKTNGYVTINDDVVTRFNEYFREHAEVGDGVTLCLWSDRHAYDIIARTPQTLTLQRCNHKRIDNNGMSDCQDYEYSPNPKGDIIVAHWSKKDKVFRYKGMAVNYGRHEFFDYSF